jgi:phosphate starvation-inducible PhoH-like protein
MERMEINIDESVFARLLGEEDANLRQIENQFTSRITARNGVISVRGPTDEQKHIRRVFHDLEALGRVQETVTVDDVSTILRLVGGGTDPTTGTINGNGEVFVDVPRGRIHARGANQERYVRLINRETVVFSVGPAGTGKTYLAVAAAIDHFNRKDVEKIILVRPVVESGETLGFLPGDILEKVDPYFRPLYDALDDMFSHERVRRYIEKGIIEIAPLAYMRGRTLNSAFVILDEAQNTTSGQMKMFLTRLGVASKAVLTGDLTQIDLPDPSKSGLLQARELLRGIDGIGFIEFNDGDVVRHRLVAEILRAYHGLESGGIEQD